MRPTTPLPPGVSATRVIAFVQGALGALSGVLLIFGAGAVAVASGMTGGGATATVVAIGVVVLVVSILLVWGGVQLGRLAPAARVGVLVYEVIAVLLGLVGLQHPGLGIVSLLLAGVAVYYLQFDAATRAAFASRDQPPPAVSRSE